MDLSAFEQNSITQYKGLYKRGLPDECPPDHSICNENCNFQKTGEVRSRDGMVGSEYVGHAVTRQFLSITGTNVQAPVAILLTCDGNGHIYQNDNPSPILTAPGLIDFSALNLAGHTYILPINAFSTTPKPLQVWDGVATTTRNAAGLAPSSSFTAGTTGSGNVDAGVYQIAVSFITSTGFITPPSPLVTYTAPGGAEIALSGIPLGPAGTIGRQITITQANQSELFFLGVTDGGLINDNTTTTTTLNFFDTDLAISADYLNDLYQEIPGSFIDGDLLYYHSRLCVINWNTVVLASRVQDPESINMVDGLIQIPVEGGALVYGMFDQNDILYVTGFPGIWSVQDNTLEPAFWPIVLVEGGMGSFANGIGTLSATTNALSLNGIILLADRNGLFSFSGGIARPALTWKIDDLWKQINFSQPEFITTSIDPFTDRLFVIAPVGNGTTPGLLLMGDYSEGLDAKNIKWSMWTFPYTCISAEIYYFQGNLDASAYYALRVSFLEDTDYIYSIPYNAGNTSDAGAQINAYYTCYLAPISLGNVNLYRALRFRAMGSGSLNIELNSQDFNSANQVSPADLTLSNNNAIDLLRQINYMNEKCSVTFGVDQTNGTPNDNWIVTRLDIFGKSRFNSRPQ